VNPIEEDLIRGESRKLLKKRRLPEKKTRDRIGRSKNRKLALYARFREKIRNIGGKLKGGRDPSIFESMGR